MTGKAITGATVELNNLDNGRKIATKTDSHGQYSALAAGSGNYKISLLGADGKPLFFLNNVPVQPGVENVYDFDLAKLRAEAAKQSGTSEAQRKEIEKLTKENEKIKSLNALLSLGRPAEERERLRRGGRHHGAGRRPGSDPRCHLRLAGRRLPGSQEVPRSRKRLQQSHRPRPAYLEITRQLSQRSRPGY